MEARRHKPAGRWLGERRRHRIEPVRRILLGRRNGPRHPGRFLRGLQRRRSGRRREKPRAAAEGSHCGQRGDKVNHTSFGNGTVLAVEGAGDKTVAKVKFDVGEKRLLLRYAPLTKIDA
jgi:hypothetical protein